LPDRLIYLEPVQEQLAGFPLEEMNEDMDTAPFEEVLRERIIRERGQKVFTKPVQTFSKIKT